MLARDVAYILGGIRRPAFRVQLNGLNSFGGHKPRAVVAPAQPVRELDRAAGRARAPDAAGRARPKRKYKPHVTLARLRDCLEPTSRGLPREPQPFRPAPFPVSRFVLYSSRASVGGGPYVIEAEYPLAA